MTGTPENVGPVVVGLEAHSGRGGDIDDGSAASPLHGLYRSLHDIHVGGQEDLQDAPPVPRLRHWVEGRVVVAPGIVNQDVEAAERPLSDGDRPLDLAVEGDIGVNECRFAPRRLDHAHRLAAMLFVHVVDDDVCAGGSEPKRDAAADAVTSARDERDPIPNVHGRSWLRQRCEPSPWPWR